MTYLDLLIALTAICEGDTEVYGTPFEEVTQFDEIKDFKKLIKFAEKIAKKS